MKQKTKILLQFSHTKRGKNGQIIKIKTNKKKFSVLKQTLHRTTTTTKRSCIFQIEGFS